MLLIQNFSVVVTLHSKDKIYIVMCFRNYDFSQWEKSLYLMWLYRVIIDSVKTMASILKTAQANAFFTVYVDLIVIFFNFL